MRDCPSCAIVAHEPISRGDPSRVALCCTTVEKALAAVVPLEDRRLLETTEDRLDAEDGRRALTGAKVKGEQPVAWEQVKAELSL